MGTLTPIRTEPAHVVQLDGYRLRRVLRDARGNDLGRLDQFDRDRVAAAVLYGTDWCWYLARHVVVAPGVTFLGAVLRHTDFVERRGPLSKLTEPGVPTAQEMLIALEVVTRGSGPDAA